MVATIIIAIVAALMAAAIEYGIVYIVLVIWGIATPMLALKVYTTILGVIIIMKANDSK